MLGHKKINVFLLQLEAKRRRMFGTGLGKYCLGIGSSALAWKVSSLWFFWTDWGYLPHWGYLYRTQIQNRNRLFFQFNPRTYTHSLTPTAVQGVGGWWNPPLSFWYVAVFRNDFAISGKPLTFSKIQGIFYGWWRCWRSVRSPNMVATLYFIKN